MMTTIVLDTNIWIYLTKDSFFLLWLKLKEMKESSQIHIVVNDIILLEWKRNRPRTINKLSESIKDEYKSALKLANYLQDSDRGQYINIISTYNSEDNRIEKAKRRVQ